MSDPRKGGTHPVYKSLHKPLTYFGVERAMFFLTVVAAVVIFNVLGSLLAAIIVFLGCALMGYWITNADPAFLRILARATWFKTRYDAAKRDTNNVEIH